MHAEQLNASVSVPAFSSERLIRGGIDFILRATSIQNGGKGDLSLSRLGESAEGVISIDRRLTLGNLAGRTHGEDTRLRDRAISWGHATGF